jgi:hypothetical protein
MISNVWRAHNLQPHRTGNFKLSRDARFLEKQVVATFGIHITFGYSVIYIWSWVDAQANLPIPGKVDRESGCGSLGSNQAGSVDPPDTEGFFVARSEIRTEKMVAYPATEYRFGEGLDVVTLRIDRRSEELARLYGSSGTTCGVFVTANNSFGHACGMQFNEAAHEHLGADLAASSTPVMAGVVPIRQAHGRTREVFSLSVSVSMRRETSVAATGRMPL